MTTIDWYFDFISPYAYLQCERLERFAGKATINYRPVLFAGLLNHWEHKGPAEIPAKRSFTYRQSLWLARRHGIKLKAPPVHPFHPLGALRLAIALDCRPEAVQTIFRFIWRDGRRPDDPAEWDALTRQLGLTDADAQVTRPEVKAQLRANTDAAIARGVFGVPTAIVGEQMFWGFDATDMALDYLADPASQQDTEMLRHANLPVGIERVRR